MTQFCGKTLYHLQHASVDQPISNFRKKHHKYVRKKKHQWNKKLNTFNLAITDTETSANLIVEIMHKLHLTMVDQKVFNALTDTKSSMRCYVCSATHPNNSTICPTSHTPRMTLTSMEFHHSTNGFVVSRCSYTFHTEYKLLQKWQNPSADQAKVSAKKKLIHNRFKAELGLGVDEPKEGAGNTNDGNTGQRTFGQEEKFTKIHDRDESLMHRFHMILVAISCKHPMDPNKF